MMHLNCFIRLIMLWGWCDRTIFSWWLLEIIWSGHSTMLLYKLHFVPLLFRQLNVVIIDLLLCNSYFFFFLTISVERSAHKLIVFRCLLWLCACHSTTINVLEHTFIWFKHFRLIILLSCLLGLLLLNNSLFLFKLRFSLILLGLYLRWLSNLNFLILLGLLMFVLLLIILLLVFWLGLLLVLACAWLRTLLNLL